MLTSFDRPRRVPRALWAVPLVGLAVVLAACHGGPHLAFTVTTAVDGGDADPGDGICERTTGAGDCSLRAAVDEANASAPDTEVIVSLPPGIYSLTGAADEDSNAGGDLDLRGLLRINAGGPGVVINGAGHDRVFDVHEGELSLTGVTVSGGVTSGFGGGVQLASGTSLDVLASTFTGNQADLGGAVANGAGARTAIGVLRRSAPAPLPEHGAVLAARHHLRR